MSDLEDKTIRRSHFIERYKTGVANQFDEYLRQIDKAVRDILSKSDEIKTAKQLAKIQTQIRLAVFDVYKEWNNKLKTELVDFSASEIAFLVKALDMEVNTPSKNTLRAAITSRPFQNVLLREALADLRSMDAKMIKNAIASGFYSGQSNAQIIRTIRGTASNNFRDGLLNLSKNRTTRLVRTAINHTSARAKEAFFIENSDIIERYKWVATLDSRTSDICRSLDGRTWKVGSGPLPPAHFNCRSTVVAVV